MKRLNLWSRGLGRSAEGRVRVKRLNNKATFARWPDMHEWQVTHLANKFGADEAKLVGASNDYLWSQSA